MIVSPTEPVSLRKVTEKEEDFEKLPGDFDLPDTYYYLNEMDGMAMDVQTQRGRREESIVTNFFYFPMASERHLKCPSRAAMTVAN